MIAHSAAYLRLKQNSQELLNFSVLVCTAAPLLMAEVSDPGGARRLTPDYFKGAVNKPQLASFYADYQHVLADAAILSLWSFFEAYVKSALREIIDFHGGAEAFLKRAEARARSTMHNKSATVITEKRRLQEPAEKHKYLKYAAASEKLARLHYRFPSELLSPFGVKEMIKYTDEKRGMRAWQIPLAIRDILGVSLSSVEEKRLEQIRKLRNRIAHGAPKKASMKDAMAITRDLRDIAVTIDRHIVEHFFVLEIYA